MLLLPKRRVTDTSQCPWRGLVADSCMGSSVSECLGALKKSHRLGGTMKGRIWRLAFWDSKTYCGPRTWVQAIVSLMLDLAGGIAVPGLLVTLSSS